MCSRFRQNLKFGNFTLPFSRLRQRITVKCVPHAQHDYFSSFNQSDHCFVASSLPSPSHLLKLPNNEFLIVAKRVSIEIKVWSHLHFICMSAVHIIFIRVRIVIFSFCGLASSFNFAVIPDSQLLSSYFVHYLLSVIVGNWFRGNKGFFLILQTQSPISCWETVHLIFWMLASDLGHGRWPWKFAQLILWAWMQGN